MVRTMLDMLVMIGALVIGILFGRFFNFKVPGDMITLILMLLVFFVGVDIGREEGILKRLKSNLFSILSQTIMIILGTFCFSALASFFMPFSIKETVGAAAGFGWYSLSGVMISSLHSPLLGTVSFVSNVFRELLSILLIPVLAKINQRAAVSIAGATSMDVLLGLCSKNTTRDNTLIAFGQGVLLSLSVPVFISLIFM